MCALGCQAMTGYKMKWFTSPNKTNVATSEVTYVHLLYCALLYCTVLYCTALYCIVIHCTLYTLSCTEDGQGVEWGGGGGGGTTCVVVE